MLVEMLWQRPLRGTVEALAILMLPGGVFGVEELLNAGNGEADGEEVTGLGVGDVVEFDAIVEEPVMYEVEGLFGGLGEVVDLFIGEMLAVAVVVGIRDCAREYVG